MQLSLSNDIMPKIPHSSDSEGLAMISEWLRKYHQKSPDAKSIAELKKDFVEEKINSIKGKLNQSKIFLLSIRSSFRDERSFLRPVYSSIGGNEATASLHDFLSKHENQNPFSFPYMNEAEKSVVFDGLQGAYNEGGDPLKSANSFVAHESVFVALHKALDKEGNGAFTKRIHKFVKNLAAADDPEINSILPIVPDPRCLFAGRRKEKGDRFALDHLFVIYLSTQRILKKELLEISTIAKQLFSGLDLIHDIDVSIFRSEGLALVKTLIPLFSRQDIAPADKIAFTVEQIKKLLDAHLIGRQAVGESGGQAKAPEVLYLSSVFERNENDTVFPRLEVYPNSYREEHPLTSLRLSHVRIPSLSKILLVLYSRAKNLVSIRSKASGVPRAATIDNKFHEKANIDDERHLEIIKKLGAWKKDTPDQLSLSSHDDEVEGLSPHAEPSLWKDLYLKFDHDQKVSRPVNSFFGVLIEGWTMPPSDQATHCDTDERRCLPHGIFVVESEVEEAFSDQDLASLYLVFSGIGSLIRQIFHPHAPIDFRSALANIHQNELHVNPSIENASPAQVKELKDRMPLKDRLGLIVKKIDGKQLNNILKKLGVQQLDPENHPFKPYHLDETSYRTVKKIAKIVKEGEDADNDNDSDKALEKRFRELRDTLDGLDLESALDLLNDKAVEFLEACTENYQWSNYLASMSQVLGDRLLPDSNRISFDLMTPGYSASSMYLAKKSGEIQQVVKLSSKKKLDEEREKYTLHVRFKLMHAARMGKRAFAFDSTGDSGLAYGKEHGLNDPIDTNKLLQPPPNKPNSNYGALVSDLISSSQHQPEWALTLHRIFYHYAIDSEALTHPPELEKLEAGLKEVLNKGRVLWREPSEQAIKKIKNSEKYSFDLIETLSRINEKRGIKDQFKFENFDKNGASNSLSIRDIRAKLTDGMLPIDEFKNCNISGSITSPSESIITWIHGDMNGKNLTWADAFDSFFMIDFEHVKLGIIGADRLRLAVNLFVDVIEESDLSDRKPVDIEKYLKLSNQGISFFVGLITGLSDGKFLPKCIVENLGKIENERVQKIIASILDDLPAPVVRDGKNKSWGNFWIYFIICTISKEYQYSCRGQGFEKNQKHLEDQYCKLENISDAVEHILDENEVSQLDHCQCIKHLFVRKLLSDCFRAIKISFTK